MVNYNGNLLEENTQFLDHQNRGLRYGDALFETMRMVNGKLFFWEYHYLRLMASMRVLRIANNLSNSQARIRFTVFREKGGLYLPTTNEISYCIEALPLEAPFYVLAEDAYEVELFKDFYVNADMLSTLKTNNKVINVVGSIFAKENDYQNCLLLNSSKQVIEALNGNIFLVKNGVIKTPPLKDGCLNGIIRKKLIDILGKIEGYEFEEASISPFELQKADELFITNSIAGIQPVTKYRKKEFGNTVAKELIGKLNATARLS